MGRVQHTTGGRVSTRGQRLGWRTCLRKGCGRSYQARHWRQRYCREPDCLRELRRWQAAKRQRKRRATAEGRAKHAQAERERRRRQKRQATSPSGSVCDGARGHAIKNFFRVDLRSARLFRAPSSFSSSPRTLLWRRVPPGHASRARSRTQVEVPQDESGSPEASLGVPAGPGETSATPHRRQQRARGRASSRIGRYPTCGRRL
jgi:hypothetical protein